MIYKPISYIGYYRKDGSLKTEVQYDKNTHTRTIRRFSKTGSKCISKITQSLTKEGQEKQV